MKSPLTAPRRVIALAVVVVLVGAVATVGPTLANSQTHAQNDSIATAQNHSGNLTTDEVIHHLRQSYQQMDGYNATVVASQTTIKTVNGNVVMNETTHIKSRISVKFPNKIRSVLLKPESDASFTYIFNDNVWTIYDASNNTVVTYKVKGLNAANVRSIRYTLAHSDVSYEGTATVAGQQTYVLSVRPSAKNQPSNQTYYLDQETYLPVKTVSENTASFGNTTTTSRMVSTSQYQINPGIPNSVFTLDPPENATCLHTNRLQPNSSVCDTLDSQDNR